MFKGACHLDDPAHRTIIFALTLLSQEISFQNISWWCVVGPALDFPQNSTTDLFVR
jgi:hypothetical protein